MRKNFLIVKLSAIGDVIHALPAAHALKTSQPDCHITWIVEKAAYDLVHEHPYIDEVIVFDKARCKSLVSLFGYIKELYTSLHSRNFDVALDLQGLFKSAAISFLSGASEKLVYCNAREGSHLIGKKICGDHADGHIVERYLDVIRYLGSKSAVVDFGLRVGEREKAALAVRAKQAGFSLASKYVVLAPGANWGNKRWPVEHFAELGNLLYNRSCIPVLIGGPGDAPLAEAIQKLSDIPPVSLVGKTSLKELFSLLQQAGAFVGGDTGPMHLAAATGVPVIALFGPTTPERNGPYSKDSTVLQTKYACDGCWQRTCPIDKDCLRGISPQAVWQALQPHLQKAGSDV